MNTFKEDMNQPLNKVNRWWIRRPVVIVFTFLTIIVGAIHGAVEMTMELYEDCW